MPSTDRKYHYYLLLHFIVLLWGFSPILGKLISFDEYKLVLWRIILTVPPMLLYVFIRRVRFNISFKELLKMLGIGVIVAAHWIMFYGAIKVSNVSVTMIAFSCGALFTAFLEPLFYKRRIDKTEIFFGAVVIGAIIMISNVESAYILGIIFGILAALGSSIFSVLNGIMVKNGSSPSLLSFVEMSGGLVALFIYGLFSGDVNSDTFVMGWVDFGWLIMLSLVCTAFSFIASVEIMKEINPYTINLTVNLESVYAIILAYFIFGQSEQMTTWFYVGAAIILITVLANGWLKFYRK